MKASRGDSTLSIDASTDPNLRKAATVNIVVETIVSVLMVCLVTYQCFEQTKIMRGGQVYENERRKAIEKKLRKWRTEFFGPPKASEEEIQRYARQLFIEATKIVRGANT